MRSKLLIVGLLLAILIIPVVQAEDANEWTVRGWAALDAGQYSNALTYFNNAIALDKNSASAFSGKAVTLNAIEDYTGALDAATGALAINAKNEKALNARAYALFKLPRYNESVLAYDALFAVVDVNTPDAYCNQGYAYWMLNKTDSAVVAYKKCTTFNPTDIMSWNNLGLVYIAQGRYENALAAFDSGTSQTVLNATLWNNKGKALVGLGRTSDALDCFNKAIGIDPGFVDALNNRENMRGKLQVYQITGTVTPTPTISRLGTFYTTVPPTVVETPTDVGTPEVTAPSQLPSTATIPVSGKATYSPLSPFTLLAALIGACGIAIWVHRRT